MNPQELKTIMGSGLLSFPLTDFDSNGDFDKKGYEKRLEWLSPYDATALFAAGGTGEFFSLTGDEYPGIIKTAVDTCRGVVPIIAGAGGAAHLPGMLAAVTPLPVIGVPVALAVLDGLDSLLSIVQMPAGVPVATVAVGGARNAGLLAVRILAAGEDDAAAPLRTAMLAFQAELADAASAKGERLRTQYGSGKRAQPTGFSV